MQINLSRSIDAKVNDKISRLDGTLVHSMICKRSSANRNGRSDSPTSYRVA
jgi:hypothetical protein